MRILVHDYAGHPFQAQLSRALAKRGHEVCHAYAGSLGGPQGALSAKAGDAETLRFTPIGLGQRMEKVNLFRRRKQERAYGAMLADLVRDERPDVVLSANTPSEAQARLADYCKGSGIRFVSWVQDIYGLAAYRILRRKLPLIGGLIGRYFMFLDRRAARGSAAVVLISEDFLPQMRQWGVPEKNMQVIPNWAPLEEVPVRPRKNAWSYAHGLSDRFCFLYSGTLAMKHNPELLLELARRFRDRPEVRIVVVSEGAASRWLAENATREGLTNVLVFPFQPFADLPQVLATADVLVSILEPDAAAFSVPSKVLTYLCANRAQLLAVPTANLAVQTVVVAKAGFVVPPGDLAGFASAAKQLVEDPVLRMSMGQNGRLYAEQHFDIRRIADHFQEILWDITAQAVTAKLEPEEPRPAKRRILVLDDETDFLDLMKLALEGTGDFEVLQVYSAPKVLEAAREFRPDVILLDCMVPEMSGEEVAAQIQADPELKHTPFFYLTARVGEPETRPDTRGDLQTYLPKPLRLPLLLKCIDERTGRAHPRADGDESAPMDGRGNGAPHGSELAPVEKRLLLQKHLEKLESGVPEYPTLPARPERVLQSRVEKLESGVLGGSAVPVPTVDQVRE